MYRRLLTVWILPILGKVLAVVGQSIVIMFTTAFLLWIVLMWLATLDVDRTPEPYYRFPETIPSDRRIYVV